jgi:hypothetical protein
VLLAGGPLLTCSFSSPDECGIHEATAFAFRTTIPGGIMNHTIDATTQARRAPTVVVGACVVILFSLLAGCSSTKTATSTATPSSTPPVPASAYRDFTGITPQSVTIGNVSTQTGGLFKGAVVGTEAYAAYVNAHGGINGRTLIVRSADDQFAGALNKQLTEMALQHDFATVGGFSLEDSFAGTILASNPQFPDISVSLDPATQKLPNNFSPTPAAQGWPLGPLAYFKKRFPGQVAHTATIVANLPSTVLAWNSEKSAMQHLGYTVLYDPELPATQTDFTQNVVAMKDAGVKILFLEQLPQNYASSVIKDLNQQNFHPTEERPCDPVHPFHHPSTGRQNDRIREILLLDCRGHVGRSCRHGGEGALGRRDCERVHHARSGAESTSGAAMHLRGNGLDRKSGTTLFGQGALPVQSAIEN